MAVYAIYSYEIQEGGKSLFYKDTSTKAIDMANEIIDNDYPQSYHHLISQESFPCCLVQHGTLYQPTQHAVSANTARRDGQHGTPRFRHPHGEPSLVL